MANRVINQFDDDDTLNQSEIEADLENQGVKGGSDSPAEDISESDQSQ